MAIRETIKKDIQMGASNVIMESDSQRAINVIVGYYQTPNLIRNSFEDIRNLLICIRNI